MPLDPDDTATTARDFVLSLISTNAPGTVIEIGLRNADSVELDPLDCPGYERFPVPDWSALWASVTDGTLMSNDLQFADATAEWTDAAYEDCIYVDGYAFDAAPLVDPVVVTAAGDGPVVQIVRAFSSAVG